MRVERAFGTPIRQDYAKFEYTPNGERKAVVDANGSNSAYCNGSQASCWLLPTRVSAPDGGTVDLAWDFWTYCWGMIDEENEPCSFYARLGSVSNSFGYEVRFAYSSDGEAGPAPPPQSWHQRTGATFHNSNVSGSPALASVAYSYPSTGVTQVTDAGGRVWRFSGSGNRVTAIRRPGAASDTTVAYDTGISSTAERLRDVDPGDGLDGDPHVQRPGRDGHRRRGQPHDLRT